MKLKVNLPSLLTFTLTFTLLLLTFTLLISTWTLHLELHLSYLHLQGEGSPYGYIIGRVPKSFTLSFTLQLSHTGRTYKHQLELQLTVYHVIKYAHTSKLQLVRYHALALISTYCYHACAALHIHQLYVQLAGCCRPVMCGVWT